MEHNEEYYKQKYIKYKMKFVDKLEKKNKKKVKGGNVEQKKKTISKNKKFDKKNKNISKKNINKTVKKEYTVTKKKSYEINFDNMDDIRLLMLYPELKRTSYWENSKACNNSKTFFGCNNNGSSFCFNGVCIDLKDVDYTNMLYLCTAWQNKKSNRITNFKKNFYNYLIYLKKLKNINTEIEFDENMFNSHISQIATE